METEELGKQTTHRSNWLFAGFGCLAGLGFLIRGISMTGSSVPDNLLEQFPSACAGICLVGLAFLVVAGVFTLVEMYKILYWSAGMAVVAILMMRFVMNRSGRSGLLEQDAAVFWKTVQYVGMVGGFLLSLGVLAHALTPRGERSGLTLRILLSGRSCSAAWLHSRWSRSSSRSWMHMIQNSRSLV